MNLTTGRPENSNVLIKPRLNNDKIFFKNGGFLFIDTKFDEMMHTNIVADVIQVPPRASHENILEGGEKEIVEDIVEVQVGDVVFVHYLAIQNALKNKFDSRAWIENGELYILVRYFGNIFMAIRNEVPIMVNDFVLIEPTYRELKELQEKSKISGVAIPQETIEKHENSTQWGIVRYVGKNLSIEHSWTDEDLTIGKEVFFRKNADIPLEAKLHQTFEIGKKLFRIRRRDIFLILE